MKILIFDSGLGALSVSREIVKLLPAADITYLADHAYFPYGRLSEEEIIKRVCCLIKKACERETFSSVVIACNTASTIVMPALRAEFDLPFIGTVPAIKPAALQTVSGLVSVLATPGTVKRDYTKKLIEQFAYKTEINLVGAVNLADICEAILRGETVADALILAEIMPCFIEKNGYKTDIIVLGCTHYPLILETLIRLSPWQVDFIDPAPAIAARVKQVTLEDNRGLAQRHAFTTGESTLSLTQLFKQEGYILNENSFI
jgi:glutamate racemase